MIVDLFLNDGFERLTNEFSSLGEAKGFGGIEGVLCGDALGGDLEVIEVGGGLFEKHFAGGFVRAFGADGHAYGWGERKIEFVNFTYLAQMRNWGLTHPTRNLQVRNKHRHSRECGNPDERFQPCFSSPPPSQG